MVHVAGDMESQFQSQGLRASELKPGKHKLLVVKTEGLTEITNNLLLGPIRPSFAIFGCRGSFLKIFENSGMYPTKRPQHRSHPYVNVK